MVPGQAPFVVLVLVLLAAGLALELRRRRADARALAATAGALGAIRDGHTLRGDHDGIRYRCSYTPPTRHTASAVTVGIPAPVPGEFRIARERTAHRLLKRLGLDREVTTGDPDFDHDFHVAADGASHAAAALADPDARAEVAALFQLRCAEVTQTENELQVRWVYVGAGAVDVSILRIAVAHLAGLGGALARAPGQPAATATVATATAGGPGMLLFIPLGLAAAAIGGLVADESRVLDPIGLALASLKWSIPALVLYLIVAARLLAGRVNALRELAAVALLAVGAFPLAGFFAMAYANGSLDESPPHVETLPVVRTYAWPEVAGRQLTYWAEVKSWRGRGHEYIRVSGPDRDSLGHTGARLTIDTRPGRFGFEWIASYRVDPSGG